MKEIDKIQDPIDRENVRSYDMGLLTSKVYERALNFRSALLFLTDEGYLSTEDIEDFIKEIEDSYRDWEIFDMAKGNPYQKAVAYFMFAYKAFVLDMDASDIEDFIGINSFDEFFDRNGILRPSYASAMDRYREDTIPGVNRVNNSMIRGKHETRYIPDITREYAAEKLLHRIVDELKETSEDVYVTYTSINVIDDDDTEEKLDLAADITYNGKPVEVFIQSNEDDMDEYYLTLNTDERQKFIRVYTLIDEKMYDQIEEVTEKIKTFLSK